MKKRILSFALAVMLALSVLSALAYMETQELTWGTANRNTRLYEWDSTKADVLTTVKIGREMVFLWETENYYYVAYGNYCGYVQKKHVDPYTDVVSAGEFIQTDRATRLYKTNSTKKGSVAKVSKGEWLLLISETENYSRVARENRVGYVLKKYTSRMVQPIGLHEVVNTVYTTADGKSSMEIGETSEGDVYLYLEYNNGRSEWYGELINVDSENEYGLKATFKRDSDGSTILVEWSGRESMDFPEVFRGKGTQGLPSGMFTDYLYDYMLTGTN